MRVTLSLLAAIAAAALVGAVAALAEVIRPAQYFGGYVVPGQGGHTDYSDGCSFWWIDNKAVWPGGNYARVTYIDVNGGWHYTVRSTISPIAQDISLQQSKALGRTKLRCENASDFSVFYLACYSLSDNFTNCV